MSSQSGQVDAEVGADGVLLQRPAHLGDLLHHRVCGGTCRNEEQPSQTRVILSAAPPRLPTSVRHVELDPEVSGGASGAVAGREDDPADGLDLPDDAGNSRGGQEAVVSDNQPADLKKIKIKNQKSKICYNRNAPWLEKSRLT